MGPRYSCARSKPCLQMPGGWAGVRIPASWVGWPCLAAPHGHSGHVAAGQRDISGKFGFGRRWQGRCQHRGVQGDAAWSGTWGIRMWGSARLSFWGWYNCVPPVQLLFLPGLFSSLPSQQTGLNPETPFLDPCLPVGLEDTVARGGQTLYVRGRGDWPACVELLQPLLAGPNSSQASLAGAYKAPIDFGNSEFYGFSEFFYCTEDVLRLGGHYSASTFTSAAQVGAAPAQGQGSRCSQGWEGVVAVSLL